MYLYLYFEREIQGLIKLLGSTTKLKFVVYNVDLNYVLRFIYRGGAFGENNRICLRKYELVYSNTKSFPLKCQTIQWDNFINPIVLKPMYMRNYDVIFINFTIPNDNIYFTIPWQFLMTLISYVYDSRWHN